MAIVNFIKGFLIGIALVIPGLSGSMFAVVVGLYDKILDAVNNFFKDKKKNFFYLLPIVIGVLIGILASTKAVLWVCETFPAFSYVFFIGLILGSFPLVFRKINTEKFNPLFLIISMLTCSALLIIAKIQASSDSSSYIAIASLAGIGDFLIMLFAGVFASSLMAIPGVSGSVMLMVIGQYGTVYNSVSVAGDCLKFLFTGNFTQMFELLPTVALVIPFGIGIVVGLLLIAKLLGWLLNKYEAKVYYGVLGLVIGSCITLFMDGVLNNFTASIEQFSMIPFILISIVCLVVGVICTKFFDK